MKQEILHKYYNGTASDDERREVLAWVDASPANKEEFLQREADFVFGNLPDSEPSQAARAQIMHVVEPKRKRLRILNAVASAAAIFVVGAFIWSCTTTTASTTRLPA